MATFYAARSEIITPLPWLTFALPFSQWTAYLDARYIKKYLDAGTPHLIPDAPRFPYPVWAVWRGNLDTELTEGSRDALLVVSQQA